MRQPARRTRPALRHFTHAFTCLGVPLITVRTRWMFGFQRRLFRLWEKETLLPKPGVFPQISQTADMRGPMVAADPSSAPERVPRCCPVTNDLLTGALESD